MQLRQACACNFPLDDASWAIPIAMRMDTQIDLLGNHHEASKHAHHASPQSTAGPGPMPVPPKASCQTQ